MEAHRVTLRDGSTAILYCSESGSWACPICGSVELSQPPYYSDGSASFDMCSCGFEFGYDDDPGLPRKLIRLSLPTGPSGALVSCVKFKPILGRLSRSPNGCVQLEWPFELRVAA